jgi:hypothetical protein
MRKAAIDLPDVYQIRQEPQEDKRSSASRAAVLFQQSSPQAEPGILHSCVATVEQAEIQTQGDEALVSIARENDIRQTFCDHQLAKTKGMAYTKIELP